MVAYYVLAVIINHGGIMSALQQAYIIIFVMAMYNCDFTRASLRIVTALANLFVWVMWIVNGRQYGSVYLSTQKGLSFNSNTVSELLLFQLHSGNNIQQSILFNKSRVVYIFHGKEIKHPHLVFRCAIFCNHTMGNMADGIQNICYSIYYFQCLVSDFSKEIK